VAKGRQGKKLGVAVGMLTEFKIRQAADAFWRGAMTREPVTSAPTIMAIRQQIHNLGL